MNTAALHVLIRAAQQHEADTRQMARHLQASLAALHPSIRLPENEPEQTLLNFISEYINHVPLLLQSAHEVAKGAGISSWIEPVLKIAEEFFLHPPELLAGHEGLDSLLDEAYLALRLVEEINDRYILHLGKPLIPVDITVANLIVHQLIGEPFANQLDEAVRHAVSTMLTEDAFDQTSVQDYRERLCASNVETAWLRWPCFSRQLGVELMLTTPEVPG